MNPHVSTPPGRRIYCNRTLNMRSIRAIGYDMDYTLIHYHADIWERMAYQYLREGLQARGWPVGDLTFDSSSIIRGLIIDTRLGNIVKANRFGYIKRASHGSRLMSFEEQRSTYAHTVVSLSNPRWRFMNTLFSLSEACMYSQLVDMHNQGLLLGSTDYQTLYATVRATLDAAHIEGRLKADIIKDPSRFVDLDPETPLALLDQKHAGKKLLLITNSGWNYTQHMMTYAFDRYLPGEMTWRDLFEVVMVAARKPAFFRGRNPLFEIINKNGDLHPTSQGLHKGGLFYGGSAGDVERYLKMKGSNILYVGDHVFGDVKVAKNEHQWRTALVLHDLEDDLKALEETQDSKNVLRAQMHQKNHLENQMSHQRLMLQRLRQNYGPQPEVDEAEIEAEIARIREQVISLDTTLAPLARQTWELNNTRWGLLMRAGNDKSHLARQIERYADIYMSRVSNFLHRTPFSYIRSHRGSLPHDQLEEGDNPFQTDGPWSST